MTPHTSEVVEITVNGDRKPVPGGLTLLGLLIELGIEPDRVAVEFNRKIVRQPLWAETKIEAGANLEIVQFVGGG